MADYRERNGIGWNAWRTEERRFRSLISDAIDNEDPTIASAFDPAVTRMAQWSRDFYGSYRELAQNPGRLDGTVRGAVRGMEELPPNAHYVPHIWDFQTFGEYVRRFGDGQMTRLLSDAIHSHIGGDYRQADKVGQGYFKALRTVQAGQEASLSGALSGANKEGLRAFLRQSTDLADEEINSIVTRLGPTHNTEGNLARTKQRQGINAHFTAQLTDPRTGEVVSVAVKDLLERDALKVSALYNRQMSAQVALARLRIENPKWTPEAGPETPRYLVDGIRGPSDWEKLRQQVFAVGDHLGHDPVQTGKAWERLSFVFDAISGTVHNTDRGKLGSALRTIRDLNFVRVMNQVGFAQVADVGVMMSQVGLKAAFANMPSFRGLIRDLKTGRMSTAEARELEMIAMPGTDWIRGATHLHADDFGNVVQEKGFWGGAEHLAQRGTRITSAISGMAPINAYIQRWATKAAVAKFVTAAEDGAGAALNAKRMRVLGLSPAEQEGILGQIREHRGTFKDAETGRTVPTLNLDKWEPGARHAFEYAIFTWSRKMIQENDLGQMNVLLGTTVGKLLAQFRMFMIAGYTKNTLHNAHMRDWETVSNVLTSAVLASVPYAAQKYLQSIGRSDQQEFLDKELSTEKLAASAYSRAGWSSLMPMLADVGTYALGFDPLFDTRVTGSPSQGIISNPTFGLFDSAIRATRGAAGAAMGQQRYSQADARTAVSLLPFSNALPMVWMVNQMVHGLPEKR